jgi:hypothetical protein
MLAVFSISCYGQNLTVTPWPNPDPSTSTLLLGADTPILKCADTPPNPSACVSLTISTAPAYLGAYSFSRGYVAGTSCLLTDGDSITVTGASPASVRLSYSSGQLNITAAGGTFRTYPFGKGPSGFVDDWVTNSGDYSSISYTQPDHCRTNPPQTLPSGDNVYLMVTATDPSTNAFNVNNKLDGDGGFIPINGGSLSMQPPPGSSFICSGRLGTSQDYTKAEVRTPRLVSGLLMLRLFGLPAELTVPLSETRDWRILAYPQMLEISPERGGLRFESISSVPFQCSPRALMFQDSLDAHILRPQQFEVSWTGARRPHTVTVPCTTSGGTCRMRLLFRP